MQFESHLGHSMTPRQREFAFNVCSLPLRGPLTLAGASVWSLDPTLRPVGAGVISDLLLVLSESLGGPRVHCHHARVDVVEVHEHRGAVADGLNWGRGSLSVGQPLGATG